MDAIRFMSFIVRNGSKRLWKGDDLLASTCGMKFCPLGFVSSLVYLFRLSQRLTLPDSLNPTSSIAIKLSSRVDTSPAGENWINFLRSARGNCICDSDECAFAAMENSFAIHCIHPNLILMHETDIASCGAKANNHKVSSFINIHEKLLRRFHFGI